MVTEYKRSKTAAYNHFRKNWVSYVVLGVMLALGVNSIILYSDIKNSLKEVSFQMEETRLWTVVTNDWMRNRFKYDAYKLMRLQGNVLILLDKQRAQGLTTLEALALIRDKKHVLLMMTK